MQAVMQIGKYIFQNNHIWQVPFKFFSALRWQLVKRFSKQLKIKKLFNGKRAFLFPQTPSSSCLVYATYPDRPAIAKLRSLADSHTVFLDVGANIGFYSLLLMDKVKQVYAFEAHPDTVSLLRQNFALNHIGPRNVIAKAVSNQPGLVAFSNLKEGSPINQMVDGVQPSSNQISVPATTLDAFIKEYQLSKQDNYLIKLDVEGAEQLVIQGARSLLQDYNVKGILFESFVGEQDSVAQQLISLGYKIIPIMKNNLLAIK